MRIGVVLSVMPLRREVRVQPQPGYEAEFDDPAWLEVMVAGQRLRCKVAKARWHGDYAIVTLAPGVPRERVAALRNAVVEVAREQLRPRRESGPSAADWLDCRLETPDGATLGTVVDVMETPVHPVLVLEDAAGARHLLPAIPETIESYDPESRTLYTGDVRAFIVAESGDED